MAGYSGSSLEKKLGLKAGMIIDLINIPENYFTLFSDWPENLANDKDLKDFIHLFVQSSEDLFQELPKLRNSIQQNGMIWVSWPKKTSGIQTDVTEDTIRDFALTSGLVDIKVCAIDQIWSGLKLVIPLKDRKK